MVDSSYIAIGYVLYQVLWDNSPDICPDNTYNNKSIEEPSDNNGAATTQKKALHLKKFPLRFGLITLNAVESRYSQPKVELYGVFRALKALKNYLWGV